MPRGPLPSPNARRRNQPTIASTTLPAKGRSGRAPAVPKHYSLGSSGKAWWSWAWKLPQATRWDGGSLYTVVRRAQLEDDLALLEHFDHFDLGELLGMDEENDVIRNLTWVIGRLKSLAGGKIAVMKEMRELEGKLGLSPKALADLRWTIEQDDGSASTATPLAPVRNIRPVDPAAAAGS